MSGRTFCTLIIHWRDSRRPCRMVTDVPLLDSDGQPWAERLYADIQEEHSADIRSMQLYEQCPHGCPGPGRLIRQWPEESVRTLIREAIAEETPSSQARREGMPSDMVQKLMDRMDGMEFSAEDALALTYMIMQRALPKGRESRGCDAIEAQAAREAARCRRDRDYS